MALLYRSVLARMRRSRSLPDSGLVKKMSQIDFDQAMELFKYRANSALEMTAISCGLILDVSAPIFNMGQKIRFS